MTRVTWTKHNNLGETEHKVVYDDCKTVCCAAALWYLPSVDSTKEILQPQR